MKNIAIIVICYLFLSLVETQAQVFYDESSPYSVNSIEGGATWTNNSGDLVYNNNGATSTQRALMYSTTAYQSEAGFKLTIEYNTGSIKDDEAHNFSFGLISTDTDLAAYTGFNPFGTDTSVYSIGVNLTTDSDATARGMNFTNGSNRVTLDTSGTRTQFVTGETTKIFIEIGEGGFWSYYINDVYEASGALVEGIDLSKSYHVAIYAQDDNGLGKSIQSIELEKQFAPGERALDKRGNWFVNTSLVTDPDKLLRTVDITGPTGYNSGATQSPLHTVQHKLLERLALEGADGNAAPIDLIAPAWGDLNADTPDDDFYLDEILAIKARGYKVLGYTNSKNMLGVSGTDYDEIVSRWKEWCDTDPEAQAFINSQPYHTGIWNRTTQQYEDAAATFPDRKYMFCYAEYVIKDYSLRYNKHFSSYQFDAASTVSSIGGDNATSGIIEEQRIYQAFSNAARAGNPNLAVCYNIGRSSVNYNSFPFAPAVRFEDYTFGHAYGGNTNHGDKENGAFDRNYNHILRMMETNGYVHEGGAWTWDDKIVGNFHSKLATTAWGTGPNSGWETEDLIQWTSQALSAGGSIVWSGSFNTLEGNNIMYRDWAWEQLKAIDDYLAIHQYPDTPNWAKAYTILPPAYIGQSYYHTLVEEIDFWDPEGDAITMSLITNAPSWLTINEDSQNPGHWILSGIPNETSETLHSFELEATDVNNFSGVREVELQVNGSTSNLTDPGDGTPVWTSDLMEVDFPKFQELEYRLTRGIDFEDFDGDNLTIGIVGDAAWVTLVALAPNVWTLEGVAECPGIYEIELALSDGTNITNATVAISVIVPQFLDMTMKSISSASWDFLDDGQGSEAYIFNSSSQYWSRAILYSTESFQSDEGFVLKVNYNTGLITDTGAHNFSFGLVSTDTDMENYQGFEPENNNGLNPFGNDTSVYSLGVNLTLDLESTLQGLNFTNENTSASLDVSGTNTQFIDDNIPTEVTIEIGKNGTWSYSIGEVEEASGVISEGFDLTKNYHVVIYGQDDNGGGKTIYSINLDTCLNYATNSIDELPTENNLILYENPVLDTFRINLVSDKTVIYDVTGSVVMFFYTQADEFDVSELKTGIYIARFYIQGEVINEKIIKQ